MAPVAGRAAVSEVAIPEVEVLQRRLARAEARVAILDSMIEERTRSLFVTLQDGRRRQAFLEAVLGSLASAVVVTDPEGVVRSVRGATEALTGRGAEELLGEPVGSLIADVVGPLDLGRWSAGHAGDALLHLADGRSLPVLLTATPFRADDPELRLGDASDAAVVWMATDVSVQRQLEIELRHAQKLESIGSLAAGVAHEINTPIQYVGDSVHFIADALEDLLAVLGTYRELAAEAATVPALAPKVAELALLEEELDVAFVEEEAPRAVTRTFSGIDRVSRIVNAMRELSHPGGERSFHDLGEVVESAVTVTRHQTKSVAEVVVEREPAPNVACERGDVGQLVVNLIVNAAHAVEDARHSLARTEGRIVVRVAEESGGVVVSVSDNGVGIPPAVRSRIFDPFFTTKETGRGTGQGLALAQRVMDRHGGRISFATETGVGTTFRCWFPLGAEP